MPGDYVKNQSEQPGTVTRVRVATNGEEFVALPFFHGVSWAAGPKGQLGDGARDLQIFRQLERINPSAANSLDEGMEETLTVHRFGVG